MLIELVILLPLVSTLVYIITTNNFFNTNKNRHLEEVIEELTLEFLKNGNLNEFFERNKSKFNQIQNQNGTIYVGEYKNFKLKINGYAVLKANFLDEHKNNPYLFLCFSKNKKTIIFEINNKIIYHYHLKKEKEIRREN